MNPQIRQQIVGDFISYCIGRLGIEGQPQIQFVSDREWAVTNRSFGAYDPQTDNITIYVGNRNLADSLRTLAHELVHHKQRELGKIQDADAGRTGSPIENEANALAGVLMRDYGKTNDLIYEACLPTLKEVYEAEKAPGLQIYCDMDGVLCDFDGRFEYYFDLPPEEYKTKNGKDLFYKKVSEAGVQFWAGMQWMPGGQELWSVIGKRNPIILSSPGHFEGAEEGKQLWIKKNLNPQPKSVIFKQAGKKQEVLQGKSPEEIKKSILIDDYYRNILPWKEMGGIAIMHKDINKTKDILSKFRISEIAYSSSESDVIYDEEDDSLLDVEYTFSTVKNTPYRVVFSSKEKPRNFNLSFGIDTGRLNKIDTFQMTGEGDAKNILETVAEIVNEFYNEYSNEIDKIIISGTDEKRTRIYKQFLPKYIDPKIMSKIQIK
jgi:hypothetical protein